MKRTHFSTLSLQSVLKNSTQKAVETIGLFSNKSQFSPANQFSPVNYDVQQIYEFDKTFSDHKMVHYSIPAFQAASFNTMMQAKTDENTGRSNTAFVGHNEDTTTYVKRYFKILENVAAFLKQNPQIAILAFQEAPIKDHAQTVLDYINVHFPEEWTRGHSDSTDWGVFTLINHHRLQTSEPTLDESLTENIPIKDIDSRCRTFVMVSPQTGLIKFTNLHLPHSQTEYAFNVFMTKVIQDIIEYGVKSESFTHHLMGDWNIEAEHLNLLVKELITAEKEKAEAAESALCCNISTELHTSKEGHLKQSGEKLSVDSLLIIRIKPAHSYHYSFTHFPALATSITAITMIMVSVFVKAVAFDNSSVPEESVDGSPPYKTCNNSRCKH